MGGETTREPDGSWFARAPSAPPAINIARIGPRGQRKRRQQVAAIRLLRSEGGSIAAIERATGLSRPTIYRILDEECQGSSLAGDGGPARGIACVTRPM